MTPSHIGSAQSVVQMTPSVVGIRKSVVDDTRSHIDIAPSHIVITQSVIADCEYLKLRAAAARQSGVDVPVRLERA